MSGLWARVSSMRFPWEFSSPLSIPLWFVLAGVPVGIIALYFLKLRRRPVRVAEHDSLAARASKTCTSTACFRRLRRNLLLFLQLLAVALAMLALAGPRMKGTAGQGQRFVLLIDCSASMSATDIAPTRLAKAKEQAKKVVSRHGRRRPGDGHQVRRLGPGRLELHERSPHAFAADRFDRAVAGPHLAARRAASGGRARQSVQADRRRGRRLVGRHSQALHLHRRRLRRRRGFQPRQSRARSGGDRPAAARLCCRRAPRPLASETSGKMPNPSDNVGIMALQTRRDEDKPEIYQLFGRVHNFRDSEVATDAQLYRLSTGKKGEETKLVDAIALKIPPQSDQSFKFDLPDTGLAPFEVRLTVTDALEVDNHAFTVAGTTRKAQVLAVTAGNRYLTDTLKTPAAIERADVTIVAPEELKTPAIARDVKGGRYDLVIFDGVKPESAPEANALYFGVFPVGAGLREDQRGLAAGHPRLGHRTPAHAICARPFAGLRRQGADRRASRGRQEPDRFRQGLAGVRRPPRGLYATPS